jgi:hypothetical protein
LGTRIEIEGTGNRQNEVCQGHVELNDVQYLLAGRNYEVTFPVKPERKPWNASAHIVWEGPDMTDIYTGREYAGYMGSDDHDQDEKEFQAQMIAYSKCIRGG